MSYAPRGRSFDKLVQARVDRERVFAEALLEEAVQAMLGGELDVARSLIRDVIKGSIGYAELSRLTGTPEKSLIRMFGPSGNPTAANMVGVLDQLQRYSGVSLQVKSVRVPKKRAAKVRAESAGRVA
jgi:DNA-binding phage protein